MTRIHGEFHDLFRGRRDAYGTLKGGVVRTAVTHDDYVAHLEGRVSIGVFPMLDDDTTWFGVIDLDEPDFDFAREMQKYLPSPSWLERSRSGNAHVWFFFDQPCPAWAVRGLLRSATQAFDRPEVEVFPKQDALREGMVGNYINLPYFGAERPFLAAAPDGGEPWVSLPADIAIHRAYADRQDPTTWVARARLLGAKPPQEREATSEWGTQPTLHECAAYIIERRHENPLRRGARHVVLFNVAKQLLNWREVSQIEAFNWLRDLNEAAEAPISHNELQRLFDNAREGRYTSTGCDEPQMIEYVSPDCPIAHA